jgi:hypothetical protein
MNGASVRFYSLELKNYFRNLWKGYFFYRYLFKSPSKQLGPIFRYSEQNWSKVSSPLFFEESSYAELFESADKAKLIAASLLSVDISEVSSSIDSFREGYPYTVYILFLNRLPSLSSIE